MPFLTQEALCPLSINNPKTNNLSAGIILKYGILNLGRLASYLNCKHLSTGGAENFVICGMDRITDVLHVLNVCK